jgi:hypothetical protein
LIQRKAVDGIRAASGFPPRPFRRMAGRSAAQGDRFSAAARAKAKVAAVSRLSRPFETGGRTA